MTNVPLLMCWLPVWVQARGWRLADCQRGEAPSVADPVLVLQPCQAMRLPLAFHPPAQAVAVCRQECRAAVAGVEARLAEQKKDHEAALGRVNAALLAIAKRVGELAAAQGK